jgi:hypothetical protein
MEPGKERAIRYLIDLIDLSLAFEDGTLAEDLACPPGDSNSHPPDP